MPKQIALRSSFFFLLLAFGVACRDSVTAPFKDAPTLATNDVGDGVVIPPEGTPRTSGEEGAPALNLVVPDIAFDLENPGISAITGPTATFTAADVQEALSSSAAPVSITSFTKFGGSLQSALTNTVRVGYPTNGSTYLIVSSGDARTPGIDGSFVGCTSDADYGTLCDVGGLSVPLQIPANATNLEFDYRYFAYDYTPFEDPFRVFIVAGGVSTRVLQVSIGTEFGTKPSAGLQYGPARHATINVTGYRGQTITLRFQASDRSDFINPGGALIDNLTLGIANAPPAIVAPPNLIFSTDPGVCTRSVAQADLGTPTVTDDAPGSTVGTPVRSDGAALDAPYPRGTTTVTWTATDVAGLSASASQTVTVNDTEDPAINSVSPVTVSTDPGQPFASVGNLSPSATDNCGEVSVAGPGAGTYPIGTTTVVWVATDGSGNQSSTSTTITVLDLEPPVLSTPASVTVPATMPTGAVVTFPATATDNSGSVSVVCTPSSGSVYGIGTTSTTCTATDPSSNATSRSFNVTVLGAADQLRDLIAFVESLNLHNGTENPLVNMARIALDHVAENPPNVSCTKLDDFLRKLEEEKAQQSISSYNIGLMQTAALRIKNVLACSPIQS